MKFFAIILTCHLCLAALEPSLAEMAFRALHHTHSCCGNDCRSKPAGCPANCPYNGNCKVCFGSVFPFAAASLLRFRAFAQLNDRPIASIYHPLISDYLAACFHPPEWV